jgi:hypothetical protein
MQPTVRAAPVPRGSAALEPQSDEARPRLTLHLNANPRLLLLVGIWGWQEYKSGAASAGPGEHQLDGAVDWQESGCKVLDRRAAGGGFWWDRGSMQSTIIVANGDFIPIFFRQPTNLFRLAAKGADSPNAAPRLLLPSRPWRFRVGLCPFHQLEVKFCLPRGNQPIWSNTKEGRGSVSRRTSQSSSLPLTEQSEGLLVM